MPTPTKFYQDLQAWIDAGTPDHPVFRAHAGICSNLLDWQLANCLPLKSYELTQEFQDAGLNPIYPFNQEKTSYWLEKCRGVTWLNPKRLNWVRIHANARTL